MCLLNKERIFVTLKKMAVNLSTMSTILYKLFLVLGFTLLALTGLFSQSYTHADSLKGTYSKERAWWDVLHYNLQVNVNSKDSSISGSNIISYKVVNKPVRLQLDLMRPMIIDSVIQNKRSCSFTQDGNAYFISLNSPQEINRTYELKVVFHGKPIAAKNAPWDGGVIWSKDKKGNPWISIACQGMAASVWFPNKDHMADEPDSASMAFTCEKNMVVVSNGKLKNIIVSDKGFTYYWQVKSPINNYNIIPYIGKYTNLRDTLNGVNGTLDLDYWVLDYNYSKMKAHFAQVKPMIRCFEDWFGPYPFYKDGYKLVEAPFLGMEHQSAIAYGNDFMQGYKGRDVSSTGWGLKWDFIIVHESGHEWFGNNISAKDVNDNWIHESFTSYAENLYVEYLFGKKAGSEYVIGTRASILNDKPIILDYNVNRGGSYDVYNKGANMLHTIRQLVNNDSLWKQMLRGLNKTFWHQTVTSKQIEDYMISFLKMDLQKVFNQYLRTKQLPVLDYKIKNGKLSYRWANCVGKFNMSVKIISSEGELLLQPKEKWQKLNFPDQNLTVDENYYILKKLIN